MPSVRATTALRWYPVVRRRVARTGSQPNRAAVHGAVPERDGERGEAVADRPAPVGGLVRSRIIVLTWKTVPRRYARHRKMHIRVVGMM
jgi:hypothetical protein